MSGILTRGTALRNPGNSIHGCDAALELLISLLQPRPERVVFLGDYLDRGPGSVRVVELMIEAKEKRPDWIFLLGNHELQFLENWRLGIRPIDANSAWEQYRRAGGIPHDHRVFLEGLLPYWESNSFLVAHAGPDEGIEPRTSLGSLGPDQLCWSYQERLEGWNGKTLVRGHVVVDSPRQQGKCISLDLTVAKNR